MRHGYAPGPAEIFDDTPLHLPKCIVLSIALSYARRSTHLNIARLVPPMSTIGLIVLKNESTVRLWRCGPVLFRICLTDGTIGHFTVFHCASVLLIRSNWALRK